MNTGRVRVEAGTEQQCGMLLQTHILRARASGAESLLPQGAFVA